MKKRLSKKLVLTIVIAVSILVLCFAAIRIINKDICAIADIVTHHIHIKSYSVADFINHTLHLAEYMNVDNTDETHIYVGINTQDDILYVFEHIKVIRDEINYYLSKSPLEKDVSEIEIWIHNRSQYDISLQVMSDTLIVGEKSDLTLNEILIQCEDFENIVIGRWRGSGCIEVTEPIDEEFFSSFTKLKSLSIVHIETKEMAQILEEATSKLRENGVDVVLETKRYNSDVSDDK